MTNQKITKSSEYFREVVEPNYKEFISNDSSFRTAFNLANALFNMRDWVFRLEKADAEKILGANFSNETQFWAFIEQQVPKAGYIRDVANASKHVKLTKHPSTSLTHVANTYISSGAFGAGGFGVGRFSAPTVMLEDQNNDVSFDSCATDLFNFWKKLVAQLP